MRATAIAIAAGAAALAVAGCAPAAAGAGGGASRAEGRVNLARCVVLEAHLYRCPGIEEPLCDPDFARATVPCLKVAHDGTLLQPPDD